MSFGPPKMKYGRKPELTRSQSQSQVVAEKLRQDGLFDIVEKIMQAVDQVAAQMNSKNGNSCILYKDNVINLCQHLKMYGAYVERVYEDQLNRAFVIFRNFAQDNERLDNLTRLHLLELIESRARGWKGSEGMTQYYRKKINQFTGEASDSASMTDSMTASISSASLLGPGEILKQSGKFPKPTHIPGKHYFKDEVVIRNADSGKVMGIKGRRVHMIEELSETIISFQRVNPGAKERLVQITGANEESINHAKHLIEDTIRRNASPVREPGGPPLTGSSSSINSSTSEDSALPHSARASRTLMHSLSATESFEEYKFTVVVGDRIIKISGDDINLVGMSKILLDEYFSGEPLQNHLYNIDDSGNDLVESPLSPPESLPSPSPVNGDLEEPPAVRLRRPKTSLEDIMKRRSSSTVCEKATYSHELLAKLAMSPLCLVEPDDWERISSGHPNLIRKEGQQFDATQYLSNRSVPIEVQDECA
ncbi:eukaryotic translation initiation factor 4E-binding protein Mextli isoform X2 [Photinus pyralis]|nr:eukaryotic translation initiation factor 4E-binding protein Mextli isoform X1 [Photinus pyralis]XP_031343485.1 eukaryotic translation initiation factor 4E-binding protein Mextli isoform X2 [Photinus pyralis]